MAEDPDKAYDRLIVRTINRQRGKYLERTGEDKKWAALGRAVGWPSSTTTDVAKARRSIRPREMLLIAQELGCQPEDLMFPPLDDVYSSAVDREEGDPDQPAGEIKPSDLQKSVANLERGRPGRASDAAPGSPGSPRRRGKLPRHK